MEYKTCGEHFEVLINTYDSYEFRSTLFRNEDISQLNKKKILESPYFSQYQYPIDFNALENSNFPLFLISLFQEYFESKPKSKSNYFSTYFSKSRDTQLETYLEAALIFTSEFLPECFIVPAFLSALIEQSCKSCDKSSKLSLQILENMIEHSFEACQHLLELGLFKMITHLISTTPSQEIKMLSYFLLSSLAIYDLGDLSNELYSYFFEASNHTSDIFRLSIRAFSFLSKHHNDIINQKEIVDKLFSLIVPGCSISNESCFRILVEILQNHPQNIDYFVELGIFNIIFTILDSILHSKLLENEIHETNINEIDQIKQHTDEIKINEIQMYRAKVNEIKMSQKNADQTVLDELKIHRRNMHEMKIDDMKLYEKKMHELDLHQTKLNTRKGYELNMFSVCFEILEITLQTTRKYDDVIFTNEFIHMCICYLCTENNAYQLRLCQFLALSIAHCSNEILLELFIQGFFDYLYNYCMTICDCNDIQNTLIGSDRFFSFYTSDCAENYMEEKESLYELLQNLVFQKPNETLASLSEMLLKKHFSDGSE